MKLLRYGAPGRSVRDYSMQRVTYAIFPGRLRILVENVSRLMPCGRWLPWISGRCRRPAARRDLAAQWQA
jgi:hypothetical protein